MKIKIEEYNPDWKGAFKSLENDLSYLLGFARPTIVHIGSTSVEGLSAKPIIDILVGVSRTDYLDQVPALLVEQGYIYYPVYNDDMPYRRFFVKHKATAGDLGVLGIIEQHHQVPNSTMEHDQRFAHIHILLESSEHWIRHIAFRDYLRTHPDVVNKYQQIKQSLSGQEWTDGNDYNKAKDSFIKDVEKRAVFWYLHANPKVASKEA